MTENTTLAPTNAEILDLWADVVAKRRSSDDIPVVVLVRDALAKWGAPAPASGEPAAYRLKDDEATKHYGKDVYVYYTPNEFKTPAAFKYLEPLYTAPVLLDRIARDLLLDVKTRVNALVLLPSSERRESEIRIKQDIADFLAAPPAQEVRVPLTEKQISKLWSDAHNDTSDRMAHQVLVRLVEATHGIAAAQKAAP